MSEAPTADYYELLQISPSAEPDTVHRVYRLLTAPGRGVGRGSDAKRGRTIYIDASSFNL
jgi:hypothetical protein